MYDISTTVVGSVGGILAVIGVIVCPVTTGDTALRAARMMVQDSAGHGTRDVKISLLITLPLTAIIVLLTTLDFSVLWNYFSWMNQVLACIMLWAATVFLLKTARRKVYSLVTALPAMFMMMVTVSFILFSTQGLGLDYTLSMCIAAAVTFVTVFAYVREIIIVPAEPAEV